MTYAIAFALWALWFYSKVHDVRILIVAAFVVGIAAMNKGHDSTQKKINKIDNNATQAGIGALTAFLYIIALFVAGSIFIITFTKLLT